MAGYLGWSHKGPCQPLRICEPIKLELHRGVVTAALLLRALCLEHRHFHVTNITLRPQTYFCNAFQFIQMFQLRRQVYFQLSN